MEARAGACGTVGEGRGRVEYERLEERGWTAPSGRFGLGGSLVWKFFQGELFVQICAAR